MRKETTYLQTRLCHLCRDRAAGTRAISKEHQELDTVHLQHYLPLERIAIGTHGNWMIRRMHKIR